jgi:hypothetical protein
MRESKQGERPCTIIYLGDHDPSGIDMTRDIRERLALFGAESCEMAVNRIALNIDQINQYNPPPNPAKLTDSRAEKYIQEFGETSWELDALEPRKLDELVSRTIEQYIDADLMEKAKKRQQEEKEKLDTAEEFVRCPEKWQRKIFVGQKHGFFGGVA